MVELFQRTVVLGYDNFIYYTSNPRYGGSGYVELVDLSYLLLNIAVACAFCIERYDNVPDEVN
ncbi:MAG TPA: hypothetical protein ENH87_14945 [Pricia antarctica]|uniref:Uncharacterized protein n=1 Tax=Pricia antarctica TaxID=641691 RepID=A0A831QSA9_9FLAO|nr:hypothetical protein [Pricia antarctica]